MSLRDRCPRYMYINKIAIIRLVDGLLSPTVGHLFKTNYGEMILVLLNVLDTVNQLFFRMREIFARFTRDLLSRIFLAGNQPLSFDSYHTCNMGLDKAWSRKLVV